MVDGKLSKLKGLKGASIRYEEEDWAPLIGVDLEQIVTFLPIMGQMKGMLQGEVKATEDDVKELVSVSHAFRTLIGNVVKRTYPFDELFLNGEFDEKQSRKDALLEYNKMIANVGLKHLIGLGLAIVEHIPELLEGLPILEKDEEGEGESGDDESFREGTP